MTEFHNKYHTVSYCIILYDWISQLWLNFTAMTGFHSYDWISQAWLNFTCSTEFHIFNWISRFQLNFTISTEFHNYDWISRHQLNFAISTKFNSDSSFNRDISPSLMILFVDWYFLNRIVSICASFHSIYIQWTQFEPAAWHLHHFLILCDLLTFIVSLKQGVALALSFGSFHDLQCSLHFQVGLCGRQVVHPLHSTVSGMKNI